MRLIGASWGRTGTTSAAAALTRLGCGPVLHMHQMFDHPTEAAAWTAYRRGEPVDLEALVSRYGAGVDWPACWAWKDLAALYPEAPVLLTTRDPEAWYDSVRGSIHLWAAPGRQSADADAGSDAGSDSDADSDADSDSDAGSDNSPSPESRELLALLWDSEFGGWEAVLDREATVAAYEAHVADVRATCPPGRLLEWQVGDGWEPLAAALGVPVPDEPLPHLNARSEQPPALEDIRDGV